MNLPRMNLPLLAQLFLVGTIASTFLTWATPAAGVNLSAVTGIERAEGQLVAIVALVAIVLIQIGWRPAWIPAALGGAIAGRRLLNAADSTVEDPAIGMGIAVVTAFAAAAIMIWKMFSDVNTTARSQRAEVES